MNSNPPEKNMMSVGEILRLRREDLRKTLIEASDETKIKIQYLEMIENDQFEDFDSEIFLKGFLKNYSKFLGLKPEKILAVYRRDTKKREEDKQISLEKKPETKGISARSVVQFILSSFVLVVLVYFSFQLYNFQKVPVLTINSPENNSTTTEKTILISGESENNTIISINDVTTEVDASGEFSEQIALTPGINTITISANKKNNESKETVKVLSITYEEVEETEENEEEEEQEEEAPPQNNFTLKVEGGLSWILLLVDGNQEIGQTVSDGYEQTFTVNDNMEITSGRTSITNIYLNDSETPVAWDFIEGVGVIKCRLENNALSCDN